MENVRHPRPRGVSRRLEPAAGRPLRVAKIIIYIRVFMGYCSTHLHKIIIRWNFYIVSVARIRRCRCTVNVEQQACEMRRTTASILMVVASGSVHPRDSTAQHHPGKQVAVNQKSNNHVRPLALRLALATLWDGNLRYACALPLWCRSAANFAKVIATDVTTVIITPNWTKAQGCEGARTYWPEDVHDAMQGYLKRHTHLMFVRTMAHTILKLAIVSLTNYDLVFYSDLDVDTHSRWAPTNDNWQRQLEAFVRSSVYVAASADHSSPINTGVMLVKPREWLHQETLRVLRNNLTFERTVGFNNVGRPSTYFVNVSRLASGGYGTGKNAADTASKRLNRTQGYSKNEWNFVGAPIDQGLFWYLFYVRGDYGTWTSSGGLDHFWGPYKPWRPSGEGRASSMSRYLWRLEPNDDSTNASNCTKELLGYKQRLLDKHLWSDSSHHSAGITHIDRRSWLPAESVSRRRRLHENV